MTFLLVIGLSALLFLCVCDTKKEAIMLTAVVTFPHSPCLSSSAFPLLIAAHAARGARAA
jgi:hypothetical protein